MNIQFAEPLSRGFHRMKVALFKPFDVKKWFVVGFTAFLAGLLDGGGGGGGKGDYGIKNNVDDFGDILEAPYHALNWLQDNPEWALLIFFIAGLIFLFIVFLTWVSSRGKFMFVDNVVHDRALVAQPWREYTREGNSLFIWRLFYGLLCFAIIIGFLFQTWRSAYDLYYDDYHFPWLFFVKMGILLLLLVLFLSYIELLLNEFVVAVMYKHRLGVMQAWSRLLTIHWTYLPQFILFGLFWLLLSIAAFILVIIAALLTCCLGLILLIIPYINAVVLLPLSFTFRSFSLEFLAQFGDEYNVFSDNQTFTAPHAVG
ncbi:hypothetical protein EH223_16505 [candidate division KSB1 bacterium]|nr:hypothetical protein [candidate division KSB1 bacterium]RQW01030.1 MAG: hypothetical protein EH223_16505 [candidate division KSB1 bacterium]